MNNKKSNFRTLGPVSAQFIEQLKLRSKTVFTLKEAGEILGKTRAETVSFLATLIKRQILARIKSGVFILLEAGKENAQLTNWPIIARELALPDDCFISYYSAMRIHGMTTHALLNCYITLPKRRRQKELGGITYQFIYSKPEHFWGGSAEWVTRQERVIVSDIERTLLDGFDRPELCGGIKEIVRALWVKQANIDWKKLVRYAKKYRSLAAVKRLGFIIETLEVEENCLSALLEITELGKDYILLDPNTEKRGVYFKRWHVQINIDIDSGNC